MHDPSAIQTLRHLEAFGSPDALDALQVHPPAGVAQEGCDPWVARTATFGGDLAHADKQLETVWLLLPPHGIGLTLAGWQSLRLRNAVLG